MPYVSAKQRAYMHAKLPAIAAKWDAETGGGIAEREPKAEKAPKRKAKAGRALRAGRIR